MLMMICWIKVIEPEEAKGKIKEVYDKIREKRGYIANVFKSHSLNPESLESHLDLYMNLMFGSSPLSRADRELIATVVSFLNKCKYCTIHHSEALKRYIKDDVIIAEILKDFDGSSLDERRKEMLKFVRKITLQPNEITEEDIENLRKKGYEDREILDIVLISAYFNFVNRIVLSLGVKLERIYNNHPK